MKEHKEATMKMLEFAEKKMYVNRLYAPFDAIMRFGRNPTMINNENLPLVKSYIDYIDKMLSGGFELPDKYNGFNKSFTAVKNSLVQQMHYQSQLKTIAEEESRDKKQGNSSKARRRPKNSRYRPYGGGKRKKTRRKRRHKRKKTRNKRKTKRKTKRKPKRKTINKKRKPKNSKKYKNRKTKKR